MTGSSNLQELQSDLSQAIRKALPRVTRADGTDRTDSSPYEAIAAILVELRHACAGPNGGVDLSGRSATYRALVRRAYVGAGANPKSALSKRLTAGTAYWVRKILLDQYGEEKLRELGVMTRKEESPSRVSHSPEFHPANEDKLKNLEAAVNVLNQYATDPDLLPPDELINAAIRAVNLLRGKARLAIRISYAQKIAM